MKTATIQTSLPGQSATDSSKRPSIDERIRRLNEATLDALRNAGLARKQKEQAEREALALRETPTPYRTESK